MLPPALPGGFWGTPRTAERHGLSSMSLVSFGASSRLDMPGTPPEGIRKRCPSHLNWLLSCSTCFTLRWPPPLPPGQAEGPWWANQQSIVCRNQRWNPPVPKLDSLPLLASPTDSVYGNYGQNGWQRAALLESSTHQNQVWLTGSQGNQAPAPVAQRTSSP